MSLAACATVNAPVNTARQDIAQPGPERFIWPDDGDPTTFIALAFSGGGHRASAFAYGVLKELDAISAPDGQRLSDKVVAVSGASGGAVTAAWFGLSRRHGLDQFHDRYLLADAEQYMATALYNPATIAAALGGGANDRTTYARFVDERLFEGARFADLGKAGLASTWINATDIAHKMPFVFNAETLRALCTDLAELPLSEAIAASTAFPLVFSPMVLEAHGPACEYEPSGWVADAGTNPDTPAAVRAYASALMAYRDPEQIRFVKLMDGAITDYSGMMAFALARAASGSRIGPFTPEQAVRLRRGLILIADAGRHLYEGWSQSVEGPGLVDLARLVVEGPRDTAKRASYDALRSDIRLWERDVIAWRCALPRTEVLRLRGSLEGWVCDDFAFFAGVVSFDDLDPEFAAEMNEMPTRLVLDAQQIKKTISAAGAGMARSHAFQRFLRSLVPVTGQAERENVAGVGSSG